MQTAYDVLEHIYTIQASLEHGYVIPVDPAFTLQEMAKVEELVQTRHPRVSFQRVSTKTVSSGPSVHLAVVTSEVEQPSPPRRLSADDVGKFAMPRRKLKCAGYRIGISGPVNEANAGSAKRLSCGDIARIVSVDDDTVTLAEGPFAQFNTPSSSYRAPSGRVLMVYPNAPAYDVLE